jgi:hypothetical protein
MALLFILAKGKVIADMKSGMMQLKRKHKQVGSMLIEISVGLLIAAAAGAILLQQQVQDDRLKQAGVQGDSLEVVRRAAETYAQENYTALQSNLPITKNGVTLNPGVTAGQTYRPTIANLAALSYLPANFQTQASFANRGNPGNYGIQVRRTPVGCVAQACDIIGEVFIDQPILADLSGAANEPDNPAISAILAKLGGNGGFTMLGPTSNTITWLGSFPQGVDANPVAGNPAGVVVGRFGFGSSGLGQFVRIGDTRDPQLQGNLTVQGSITGRQNIGTDDGVAACLRAALQADGQILSRANTCVTRAFMNPNTGQMGVNNGAGAATVTLDGNTGAVTATSGTYSDRVTANSLRVMSQGLPNATCTLEGELVRDGATANSGLLICRSNRYVPVNIAANGAQPGLACTIEGDLARDLTLGSTGALICRSGFYRNIGGLDIATAGAACTSQGKLAQTSTGDTLVCQGSQWGSLASRMGRFAFIASYEVILGNTAGTQGISVIKPTCLANGTPKIYLIPKAEDSIGYFNRFATDGGTFWRVYSQDGNNASRSSILIAETYCYYT